MENGKLNFEQMDELLLLYLKGQATDEERDRAREWINEKPEHKAYFNLLKDIYLGTGLGVGQNKYNKIKSWSRIELGYYREMYQNKIIRNNGSRQKMVRFLVSAAAALVLALLTGVFVHAYMANKYLSNAIVYDEIAVPMGSKSHVTLSDGTKVWLNAGSKLRYPLQFGKISREVYLEGEGYFDVTHDKNKRFLVKTSGITVKVYGTQFNIKAYPDENRILTTLVKGSVAIETNEGNKVQTYLKPNETAVFYKSELHMSLKDKQKPKQLQEKIIPQTNDVVVNPEKNTVSVTSWKDSRWIIEGENLGQLAIMLERRYNVNIEFTNPELKSYKFTGILTDETFEQVMKIIQLSAPIEFHLDHKLVTIKEDKPYKVKYDNMINKAN